MSREVGRELGVGERSDCDQITSYTILKKVLKSEGLGYSYNRTPAHKARRSFQTRSHKDCRSQEDRGLL